MQVDSIEATVQAPGTKRLRLKHDEPLSSFAFKFNLRRYIEGEDGMDVDGEDGGGGGGGKRAGWREAAYSLVLDYSALSARLKQAPRPSDREKMDEELRAGAYTRPLSSST